MKLTTLTVRLPRELKARLRKQAKANGFRTRSAYVAKLLSVAVEALRVKP